MAGIDSKDQSIGIPVTGGSGTDQTESTEDKYFDFSPIQEKLVENYPDVYTDMVDSDGEACTVSIFAHRPNAEYVDQNGDTVTEAVAVFKEGIVKISILNNAPELAGKFPQNMDSSKLSPETLKSWHDMAKSPRKDMSIDGQLMPADRNNGGYEQARISRISPTREESNLYVQWQANLYPQLKNFTQFASEEVKQRKQQSLIEEYERREREIKRLPEKLAEDIDKWGF